MHADRTNRSALILLGTLLLAAGVGGILASFGVFSKTITTKPLFDNAISRFIGRHGEWLWWVVALICLLLLLLILRWILALIASTDRAGDLTVPGERRHGATTIRDGAIITAITTEIDTFRGVASSKARLIGDAADPTLVITVTALRDTDIATLHDRLESQALSHVRQALDQPDLPIQLDLKVAGRTNARVS
jgi:hypothetical protein